LEPNSALLSYSLGLSLYDAGRAQDSLAPLQKSTQLRPGQANAHLALAAALASLGRDNEALPEWRATLKITPASTKALDGLAKSLLATGDNDSVIGRLRAAPRDEALTIDLSTAYQNEGQTDEATQVFLEGLKAHPDSNRLTRALVTHYVHDSQFEAACKVAADLVQRKPHDFDAQHIYLQSLVIAEHNDLALPLGRKLLALAPHDANLLQLNGIVERKTGDYQNARKHLEEAIALTPKDFTARSNLGLVLAQLKDAAGAKKELETAFALGETDLQARFELARVLRTLGETEEAQKQLKLYQQQLKEKSDRYEAVMRAAEAANALKAGDKQKAAELYRKASALEPGDASLAYRLALVLADLGDVEGERSALEQAIKADPSLVLAQYQLGYLEFQAGDDPGAERQFRLVVQALPGNVQAWCSLASTLGRQSRFQEAQEALDHALKLEPDSPVALKIKRMLAAASAQH
jgi:Flp pilus assembly protein TadD